MKWGKWLENWDMTSLKIKTPFLEMDWAPSEPDRKAAWELYVELLTRISTQKLSSSDGDEKTALESIHSLFAITRLILKDNGRGCIEFSKIAIVILNQKIRPFTAKWHKVMLSEGFSNPETCTTFRSELQVLQSVLLIYTSMLADMAGIEDISALEA